MPDLAYQTLGVLLALGGAALLYWSLLHDRARGRRRCPKCWYDLRAATTLTCPECGRTAKREGQLFRTRRRWRWALVGVVLAAAGLVVPVVPKAQRDGWASVVPNTALIIMVPWFESGWPIDELFNRHYSAQSTQSHGQDWLYAWQSNLLGERIRTAVMRTGLTCWTTDDMEGILLLLERRGQGEALARALTACIDHRDPQVRAWAIGKMTANWAEEALSVADSQEGLLERFVELTHDSHPGVRVAALGALTMFPDRSDRILPVLLSLIEGDDLDLAAMACYSTPAFGDSAGLTTNAIIAHIVRRDSASYDAIAALVQLHAAAPHVVATLVAAAQDEGFELRGQCVIALVMLGASSDEVIPIAAAMLDDYHSDTQADAILALCAIGSPAEPLLPTILPTLAYDEVAADVAFLLSFEDYLDGRAEIAVPVLLSILGDPCTTDEQWQTRMYAIDALVGYPQNANAIVPVLLTVWPEVKDTFAPYMKSNPKPPTRSWPRLPVLYKVEDLPYIIIRAFESFGPSAAEALPLLHAEVESASDGYLKMTLLEAIEAIAGVASPPDQ